MVKRELHFRAWDGEEMMVKQTKAKNVIPVAEWVNIILLSKTSAMIVFTYI